MREFLSPYQCKEAKELHAIFEIAGLALALALALAPSLTKT